MGRPVRHPMEPTDTASHLRPVVTTMAPRAYLRALWRRREFAIALPAEELRSRHQNTLLGNIWHLGNPMLTVGVYYLVFGVMLSVNRGIENYLLWLTVGVFVYKYTSSSAQGGASAIAANQGLMRALQFPRGLLPLSVVIGNVLSFMFELMVLAGLAIVTGAGVSSRWFALPVVIALQSALNLGMAFITARLTDSFRDMQQLIPFVFRLLQFLSGVMYSLDKYLEGKQSPLATAILWNPIVAIIDLYRWVFLGTPVDLARTARAIVLSGAVLVIGFRYFIAAEDRYGRA